MGDLARLPAGIPGAAVWARDLAHQRERGSDPAGGGVGDRRAGEGAVASLARRTRIVERSVAVRGGPGDGGAGLRGADRSRGSGAAAQVRRDGRTTGLGAQLALPDAHRVTAVPRRHIWPDIGPAGAGLDPRRLSLAA